MTDDLNTRIARIEELDKKRLQSIDSYLATSYPNAFGQQDIMDECDSDFLNAAPEMFSIIRELKAENDALKQAVVILPDGAEPEIGDLIIQRGNIKLTDKIGTVYSITKDKQCIIQADYHDDEGSHAGFLFHRIFHKKAEILERNGIPAIYQSALQPSSLLKPSPGAIELLGDEYYYTNTDSVRVKISKLEAEALIGREKALQPKQEVK